ncbi:hypothetical protein [Pontibacillus marinus]|uniref:Uncharacterized protein n=1 Tax=Pontibacillus marinus BH030004 = DSM 16465 TaxID=1385511 RepID=A0A0A5HNE1_9BACI|nr:hypothetical protein [Pontibacillus marinus]KGX85157.1 hypothetical protein N783_11410 [Pontibacillus marinus BH030004 = DSM 16465]
MERLNSEKLQTILESLIDKTERYHIDTSEEMIEQLISQLGQFKAQ